MSCLTRGAQLASALLLSFQSNALPTRPHLIPSPAVTTILISTYINQINWKLHPQGNGKFVHKITSLSMHVSLANIILSPQKFGHDKHTFVATKDVFYDITNTRQTRVCHDKTFVATKMILVAAPANDRLAADCNAMKQHSLKSTKLHTETVGFATFNVPARLLLNHIIYKPI